MNLWINGARIPPRRGGLRIPILHAEQAIAYASENTCHPKCLAPAEQKTSSPCMRLERCAIDRPCTLKCLRVASPPCRTAVIVCVLTSSRPRDIHKVTLCRGLLQAPHPFSVFVESHMITQTRLGIVSCAAAQAPRRQGSKSPPMLCPCPKSKSFSRVPRLSLRVPPARRP